MWHTPPGVNWRQPGSASASAFDADTGITIGMVGQGGYNNWNGNL